MRWLLPSTLLLALLAGPGSSAGSSQSVDDPAGDATIMGAPAAFIDLVTATLVTNDTHLVGQVAVADSAFGHDSAPGGFVSGLEYWIEFHYRSDRFHLVIDPHLGEYPDEGSPTQTIDGTLANLYRATGDDAEPWDLIAAGAGSVDPVQDLFQGAFPLSVVEASDGFTPGPGEHLSVVEAVAYYDEYFGSIHTSPRDQANVPIGILASTDTAAFPADAWLAVPGAASGGLGVSTPQQVRFSNGEATTYHWPLSVQNHLAAPLDVAVTARTDDSAIEVRVPSSLVLQAGGSRVIDLFATVPFRHEHGSSRTIEVELTAGVEAASIALKIHYLDVAQPAGHHPVTYLHAVNPGGGQGGVRWLDTQETPDRDFDERVMLTGLVCPDYSDSGIGAFFPLSPALLIGLDAREGETARFQGTLDVPSPMAEATFYAQAHLYDPLGFEPNLWSADYPETVTLTIPTGTSPRQVDLDLDLPLPAAMGYLPPGDLNIGFLMVLCGKTLQGGFALDDAGMEIALLHGASIAWPLEEFHDILPVDAAEGPKLTVASASRRIVPGGAALWEVEVAGEAGPYVAELFGVHKDQAVLHAASADGGETVPVSLRVPGDARPGDIFEVVLSVHPRADPLASTALRLTVIVDEDGADESAQVEALTGASRDSPGAGLWALLGAVTAAVAIRRRS